MKIHFAASSAIFLLLVGNSFLFPAHLKAADTPTPLSCEDEEYAAFDRVEATLQQEIQKNLESSKSNQITGTDSAALFASTIGAYDCQLQAVCALVNSAALGPLQDDTQIVLPGCGTTFSGFDDSGARVEKKATVQNVLQLFGVQKRFAGCFSTVSAKNNFDLWSNCETLRQTKVTMAMGTLSSSLQESASRKRAGFLFKKFQDLHDKMASEKNTGLIEFARQFVTKFRSVLSKIQCTVPQTTTK